MNFLSIDIGTTNWKAVIFSGRCQPVCSEKRPTQTVRGEDGLSYYDPRQVWQAVVEMIAALAAKFPLRELSAVSVTSMGESVVPLDRAGHPLFAVIPWFDARSVQQAQQVRDLLGAERVFSVTGAEAGAIFSVPKILWMRQHYPQVFEKAGKWLQMTDYINYRLCGRIVTDPSMACRTLAFDLHRCAWSADILRPLGLDESLFPQVLPSGSLAGQVSREAAGQTGLPEGLPVVLGGHDHPVASIAGCAFSKNMLFDSSGTAEPFLHISDPGEDPPRGCQGQRCTRHPDPRRFIHWGGIVASGVCVDWAVHRFASHFDFSADQAGGSYDALFSHAARLSPGCDGLLFLPSLRGSGAPEWDPRRRGALLGLTTEHTGAHILRAVLEGLSYQAKRILLMHQAISGCAIDTITCMGGGARISLWQQIKADVTGCTVKAGRVSEATPLGAAMLCASAMSGQPLEAVAREFQPEYRIFSPDPTRTQGYAEFFEEYLHSGRALEGADHSLFSLAARHRPAT